LTFTQPGVYVYENPFLPTNGRAEFTITP
jgi:hypothetical protein